MLTRRGGWFISSKNGWTTSVKSSVSKRPSCSSCSACCKRWVFLIDLWTLENPLDLSSLPCTSCTRCWCPHWRICSPSRRGTRSYNYCRSGCIRRCYLGLLFILDESINGWKSINVKKRKDGTRISLFPDSHVKRIAEVFSLVDLTQEREIKHADEHDDGSERSATVHQVHHVYPFTSVSECNNIANA